MTLTLQLLRYTIVLAAGSLSLGCLLNGLWAGAFFSALLGVLWWVEIPRSREWVETLLFLGCVLIAAVGVKWQVNIGWLLFGVIWSLSAWDLQHFEHRLRLAEQQAAPALERAHLRRLLSVNTLSVVLTIVALALRVKLGFGVLLLLTTAIIVSLSQFYRHYL